MRKANYNYVPMKGNTAYEADTLETTVKKMLENGEPIGDLVNMEYTERKDGVRPEFNVRTDKMDLAMEAMSVADKTHKAKRAERMKIMYPERKEDEGNIEPAS